MIDVLHEATVLVSLAFNCQILGKDRAKIRAIGERLHEAGGIETMRAALTIVTNSYPHGAGRWHPAEIEAAWDGIGDWRR